MTPREYVMLARAIWLLGREHGLTRGQVLEWLGGDSPEYGVTGWPDGLRDAAEAGRPVTQPDRDDADTMRHAYDHGSGA